MIACITPINRFGQVCGNCAWRNTTGECFHPAHMVVVDVPSTHYCQFFTWPPERKRIYIDDALDEAFAQFQYEMEGTVHDLWDLQFNPEVIEELYRRYGGQTEPQFGRFSTVTFTRDDFRI